MIQRSSHPRNGCCPQHKLTHMAGTLELEVERVLHIHFHPSKVVIQSILLHHTNSRALNNSLCSKPLVSILKWQCSKNDAAFPLKGTFLQCGRLKGPKASIQLTARNVLISTFLTRVCNGACVPASYQFIEKLFFSTRRWNLTSDLASLSRLRRHHKP